jgi:Ca2+:H+ antiporter
MTALLGTIRDTKILWLLIFVPITLIAARLTPHQANLLFILSVAAIIPLAALLSHATEAVAARTGDSIGGLLNATLGNLTELIIALTALKAGEYLLVKASIAGAIVTNTLFMMGAAFLIGGLRDKVQEFSLANARVQLSMLLLATVALLVPSAIGAADKVEVSSSLSVVLSLLLIGGYGLGLLFSLGTHRDFMTAEHDHEAETGHWPMSLALVTLAGTTVLVALVSEVFIESLTVASASLGISPAFTGFIVVALVGAAAEMTTAFAAAAKNRLDMAVGIAFGSAAQIAMFVAPVLVLLSYVIGPQPMTLEFWPGAVVMMLLSVLVAAQVTAGGRSAWFLGALLLLVYLIFAVTLFLLPVAQV